MPFGQSSSGREFVVFSFCLFADIHRTRVGEKEGDGYECDVYSRDRPEDQQYKKEEKRCDHRAARVGLYFFDCGGEAFFKLMYKFHF